MRRLVFVTALCAAMTAAYAESGSSTDSCKHALGFAGGLTGGYGLSYKHYFTPKNAVQFTGFAFGDSRNGLNYNIGAMYQRVLHQADITRLILGVGASWMHGIDSNGEVEISAYAIDDSTYSYSVDEEPGDYWMFNAGATIGIEIRMYQLGFSISGGYRYHLNEEYPDRYEYPTREEAESRQLEIIYGIDFTGDAALYYYF